MTVTFYTFAKNENSTKRPTGGTSKNVRLKDSTSIINPVLEMDRFAYNHSWNYCYIPDFERYYFINDTVYNNAVCEVSCRVDVLASWKTQIGSSTQYVVRSASEFDGTVPDNLYPITSNVSSVQIQAASGYPSFNNGTLVIGVISKDAIAGAVSYYAIKPANMAPIIEKMLNPITNPLILEQGPQIWFTQAFWNWITDPMGKIVSCNWFPYEYDSITSVSAQDELYLLDWGIQFDSDVVKPLSDTVLNAGGSYSVVFNVSQHPLASTRGAYMNLAPFSKYELVWSPFGKIQLDPTLMAGVTSLNCSMRWDWATGQGRLQGYTSTTGSGTNYDVIFQQGQVGVEIQLAQQTTNLFEAAAGAIGGATDVAGFFTGNGSVLGAVSGIGNAVSSMIPSLKTEGTTGNFTAYSADAIPRLIQRFYTPASDDNTHRGRPLMAVRQLNTLSGYIVCANVELDLPATSQEMTSVKSMLEGGFFYE